MGVKLRSLALAVLAAAAMSGCGGSPASSSPESAESGSLTDRELGLAESIVRQELSEERLKDATIESASVTVSEGTVAQSNAGHACDSGKVLRIRLIGDFPHIAISVPASLDATTAAQDTTVSGVLLTADHQTGQVCLVGVQTGELEPAQGATILGVR
jgi:hypothetical protein